MSQSKYEATKEKPYFRLDPVRGALITGEMVVVREDDTVSEPFAMFHSSWSGAAVRDALNMLTPVQRSAVVRRLFREEKS